MKIACVQMEIQLGDVETNFRHALRGVREAADMGADTVVLPEMWNSGFLPPGGLGGLTDFNGARTQETLGALCAEKHVNLVAGSITNFRGGKTWNTGLVFDRQGRRVAEYDKIHLFAPSHEDEYFTPGKELGLFELDGVTCGLIICYDLRFPEEARALAMKGAEILFVPAEWYPSRMPHWSILHAARAVENQMFSVGCNACGVLAGGGSGIWDPMGNRIAQAGEKECVIMAECDMTMTGNVWNRKDLDFSELTDD